VSQREGAQLQAQGTWSAGEGDDKQRFLADLRALRDSAALDFDELVARAHYPSDVLKEAESGPSLPNLPILAAYVRACDGDVPEWEERWRRLGFDTNADDGLPVRPAGASPAAVAGARAGVSVAPPDAYDPERIRAALRGSHGGSAQGVRGAATRAAAERDALSPATAEPRVPESPATWNAGTSWDETERWDVGRSAQTAAGWSADAAGWGSGVQHDRVQQDSGLQWDAGERWDGAAVDPSGTPSNGNHHASQPDDMPSDVAIIETPDAAQADALRRDPFSTAWLQDSELTSPPGGLTSRPDIEAEWPDQAEAAAAGDSWFTPNETADREQNWAAANTEPLPGAVEDWFTRRERADDGLVLPPSAEGDVAPPQEHTAEPAVTGFWTPSAAPSVPSVPAEAQQPGPPPAEDHAVPRASWTAPAEIPASDPPGAADRTIPVPVQAAAATPSRTTAGPAVPPGPVVPPRAPRSDRLYPARLLVVIVVAALIGSILVLILR
jgi:hypothetical protein